MINYRDKNELNEVVIGGLRIFTGAALLIKGMSFLFNMHELYDLTAQALPFSNFIIAHLIVFSHVVGGFCLMIGLLTRVSALVNIPIILGAIMTVHLQEGLFSPSQGLELTGMLLVVLIALAVAEPRFMAVDSLIEQPKKVPDKKRLKKRRDPGFLNRPKSHPR